MYHDSELLGLLPQLFLAPVCGLEKHVLASGLALNIVSMLCVRTIVPHQIKLAVACAPSAMLARVLACVRGDGVRTGEKPTARPEGAVRLKYHIADRGAGKIIGGISSGTARIIALIAPCADKPRVLLAFT